MENYTFEKLWEDLDNGFQIYFKYLGKKYSLHKNTSNCYTQTLLQQSEKSPHPQFNVITLKRVKELYPYMEEIEYKTD